MKPYRRLAKLFDYDLQKLKKHPTLESHLGLFLAHHDIDLVFDVGANRGQYGSMLRKVGYKGEIISFEPVSSVFEQLKQIIGNDPAWHPVNMGLGEKDSTNTIQVMESEVFSSFHDTSEFGKDKFTEQMRVNRTEEVEVTSLDNYIEQNNIGSNRRIFLKMDTQGHDLYVFKGAVDALSNIIGLQSELSFEPIYEDMSSYIETLIKFQDAGFKVTGLYPVSRNKSDLSIIEMDCVLVKPGKNPVDS